MAFDFNSGVQTGAQGAAMGGQVGGIWGAVIGGALGLVSGGLDGGKATKRRNSMRKEQMEMAKKQNEMNMREAARQINTINRQRSALVMQSMDSLYYTQKQTSEMQSMGKNQAAAFDQVGASINSFVTDLEYQKQEATARIMTNHEIETINMNDSVTSMMNQARSAFVDATKNMPTTDRDGSLGSLLSVAQAGSQLYGMYTGSVPSYGFDKTSGAKSGATYKQGSLTNAVTQGKGLTVR